MALIFSLKEGLSGFKRAKLPTIVAVLTISTALSLMGIGGVVGMNIAKIINYVRSQFDMEVFVNPAFPEEKIPLLRQQILSFEGIDEIRYISKSEAAERFNREFGENIFEVLEINPFPPSFNIKISKNYNSLPQLIEISKKLESLPGVDEVKYRKELLFLIDRYIRISVIIGLILAGVIIFASVLLVSNTVRLTIFAKREIIETMRLVGATDSFIRFPFLIEGLFQGLLGGIISVVFIGVLIKIAKFSLSGLLPVDRLNIDYRFYAYIILSGLVLGFLGSIISIKRFLSREI
ncbi:MAG: cell division protein FtsX [Fidelibacterota bacterium]